MKENKDIAIDHVILMEVGLKGMKDGAPHEDPNDPGGFTIWGLSKRAHPWITPKTTLVEARDAYEKVYWRPSGCDALPAGVDCVVVDFSVNVGVSALSRILKESDVYKTDIKALSERRRVFYQRVVDKNPHLKTFLSDWLKRTSQVEDFANDVAERSKARQNEGSMGPTALA